MINSSVWSTADGGKSGTGNVPAAACEEQQKEDSTQLLRQAECLHDTYGPCPGLLCSSHKAGWAKKQAETLIWYAKWQCIIILMYIILAEDFFFFFQ